MAIRVSILNKSTHKLPSYASKGAAGVDLCAYLPLQSVELKPLARAALPTGLYLALPAGYEAQLRPRSGLALKHGLTLLNSPGTIDSDYRGEIRVIMINLSDQPFEIKDGDRIAQMVIAPYATIGWQEVELLDSTTRGADGFGSTGLR